MIGRSLRISAGALAGMLAFTSIAPTGLPRLAAPAFAQAPGPISGPAQEQIDFEAALEGYGHWVRHPRLGDVWVPDNVPQDWQPYRIGHWVYTDDWGWYWNSDEDFGWVTYHYGRWYFDRQIGWVWIPDDEWGPAWVNWRQGDDYVGWAATPPDPFVEEEEDPDAYMFVRAGDLLAPQVYMVFIPYRERRDYYGRSVLVNRTIYFADRRGAVNPGIPPAFIASASGRPFHSSSIAPIVLAGTVGVAGAVILRNGFRDRSRTRIHVRESARVIQPGERFHRLQGLNKGEWGRLENSGLRAAQGGKAVLTMDKNRMEGRKRFQPGNDVPQDNSPKNNAPKIETKQIDRKDPQPKNFEQKGMQQQQNLQQHNLQQKPGANPQQRSNEWNRDKRPDDGKRNMEWQNTQQRNIQQKNIHEMQKSPGGGTGNQPHWGQRNQPQQQNSRPQQNIQQNHPQPGAPQHQAPGNTQRPQNDKKN